jgi:hypothetical protein
LELLEESHENMEFVRHVNIGLQTDFSLAAAVGMAESAMEKAGLSMDPLNVRLLSFFDNFVLEVGQACKGMHPRPYFLSPFFAYLLLKPTQKRDGKPTQKPSLLQACNRDPIFR